MRTRDELIASLRATGDKIEYWRERGRRVRGLANEALDTHQVKAERLLEVEETSTEIYQAIADFDRLVEEVSHTSLVAAGELAAVGDSLHLALLEITELGTTMYSVRSREPDPAKADA
jgi:hypothetical protein